MLLQDCCHEPKIMGVTFLWAIKNMEFIFTHTILIFFQDGFGAVHGTIIRSANDPVYKLLLHNALDLLIKILLTVKCTEQNTDTWV